MSDQSDPAERVVRAGLELRDTLRLAPGSSEQLEAAGAAFGAAVADWARAVSEVMQVAITGLLETLAELGPLLASQPDEADEGER